MIPRRGVKIKIFLSVVIPVVKTAFVPFSATARNPANAGAARLCGVSPHPIPDTTTALPNVAPYQLSHTRIFSFCYYTTLQVKIKVFSCLWSFMWSKPISGSVLPNEKIPQNARVARGSGLRLFPSWMKSATLPKQARYQLRYTRLFSFLSGWAYSPNQLRYSLQHIRDVKKYFQEITCPTVQVQSISMQPRDSTYLILSDFRPACKREIYSGHCDVSPAGSIRKNSASAKRSAQPPGLSF